MLQAVNPNNPAMWTGYGLLEELKSGNAKELSSNAHSAFACALQLRLDLDVLFGFAYSAVGASLDLKQSHFTMKKYIERDTNNAAAQNCYGLVGDDNFFLTLHDFNVVPILDIRENWFI